MDSVKKDRADQGNFNVLNTFEIHRANRELHKLLHKRLTAKLKASAVMTCAPGMGFEFNRMIHKKPDHNNDIRMHTMLSDIRRLAFMKCKDLTDTRARVVHLVNLRTEFCDKTGELVPPHEKTFSVWLFMYQDVLEAVSRWCATTWRCQATTSTTKRPQRITRIRRWCPWTAAR